MTSDPLLEPFTLGSLQLPNRIVSTSHEPAYTEDGMPKDRYRVYHVEKARGGVGLTMIGGSACVSKDSPASFGNIDLSDDAVVPWLDKLASDCHAAGAAVMIQVTHLGARTSNYSGDWLPLIAPSRYRETQHRAFAKEAEDFDIERIVADYAAAARRVAAAGLDGLELQHYGHLMDAFVSPWINARDDEYNGSLENRLRFPLMVIDAVRAAVPRDFVVGIRMSVDECREDGVTEDEAVEILRIYAEHGIDFLSLIKGRVDSDRILASTIPGMGTPSAPALEVCRRIRAQIPIPVMHATRIADVPTARHAIADGCVDLVGMTRAHLADPHLVRKIEAGQEDDIRPCVGANLCLDSIYVSGAAHCVHNPATGRELTLPQEVPSAEVARPRHVVVVGAGPGGLEAARVCAVRGHRVTVLEASGEYGGQVRIAARSPRRRDLIGIVDWRYQQARKHGVEFAFNTFADEEAIAALDPDTVIVATGGVPDAAVTAGGRFVHDVWDVMTDQVPKRGTVLVFDDHGLNPALDAVERLAEAGAQVVYASPERMIGIDVGSMNSPAYLEVFGRCGVEVRLAERLVDVERADGRLRATLRNEYSDTDAEISVDAVVVDHGTVPNDELYTALKPGSRNGGAVEQAALIDPLRARTRGYAAGGDGPGYDLFRIGDAVTSRNVHAAILDALRLGLLV